MNINNQSNLPAVDDAENKIALIGRAFEIKGDLIGQGTVVVAGIVNGNISADEVIAEKGSSILGNITCMQVDTSGQIKGQIEASEVIIRESASIEGDVIYSSLAIESGGTISGSMKKIVVKQTGSFSSTQKEFLRKDDKPKTLTSIIFPADLIQKLRNHESRESAFISLADGSPIPSWIRLNQDKLGLTVDTSQLEQLKDKGLNIPIRLHIGSNFFDFTIPAKV